MDEKEISYKDLTYKNGHYDTKRKAFLYGGLSILIPVTLVSLFIYDKQYFNSNYIISLLFLPAYFIFLSSFKKFNRLSEEYRHKEIVKNELKELMKYHTNNKNNEEILDNVTHYKNTFNTFTKILSDNPNIIAFKEKEHSILEQTLKFFTKSNGKTKDEKWFLQIKKRITRAT